MPPMFKWLIIALVMQVGIFANAYASDLPGGVKLQPFIRPRKSSSTQDRAFEYVQQAPDFSLNDGRGQVIPNGVGYICLLERAQKDQVLVSIRSQGLRGWAPASALVPINHAEAVFSQRIAANPRDKFAYLMRGMVRYENDDLDKAFDDVNEALRLDPKYVAALVERAYLWQCRDRLDLAIADINQAIQLDSQNSYAYVERGVFHFGMKEYGLALRDFNQAVRLGSRAAVIHLCKGMIHLERGEGEPAIAEFNVAIRLDPKRLDAYIGLATVYLLRSDAHKALEVFDHAVLIDPRSADAREARAVYFLSHGKNEKALDDLNEAVRLDPASANRLRMRARAWFEKGDFARALADLTEAVRLEPADPEAQQGRAWILATCPDPTVRNGEQAVAAATRACELTNWKVAHGLTTLAAAYSETGNFTAAVEWQAKAVSLAGDKSPEHHEYHRLLDRYKAGKPYHRLSVLEEMGIQNPRTASKRPGTLTAPGGSSTNR
jgi:tetratricopeptide (TPR) repeat protein